MVEHDSYKIEVVGSIPTTTTNRRGGAVMAPRYNIRHIRYPSLYPEVQKWVSAFCSCGIEGNKLGQHMCELWHSDEVQFLAELEDWLNEKIEWVGEGWAQNTRS